MRHPLVRLLIAIPALGLFLAGTVAAAWLALGSPTPARGATWFRIQHLTSSGTFAELPTEPFFMLVLGNDSNPDDRNRPEPGLADAIHVIGVNPATGDASILDIPRDTEAPGGGKINSYLASGGLPSIVGQLNRMVGIDISYGITTGFPGFVSMVDEIGGIDLEITEPMHDRDAGTDFEPGVYRMTGEWLLQYARDRKSYPAEGDRMRSFNQGKAMIAALATLRAQNPGATGAARLVATLARHVKTENMDLAQMFALGRLALSLDPARVKNVLVPTGAGSGTNLAVTGASQDLFADFRDDAILQNH